MNKFLFELGTEEIPAAMIGPALEQLRETFEGLLREAGIDSAAVRTYSSPRRLAVLIEELPDRQPDREERVVGPPASVGVDESGQPTAAAQGFARKQGLPVELLETVETDKGPYLAFRKKLVGRELSEILKQALPEVVGSLSWPKNMVWAESRFRFIRPLRWFVVLWNQKVLEFEFEGIASSNLSRGHRFLGQDEVKIANPDQYLPALRHSFVLVDAEERRARITVAIQESLPEGLQVLPDPELLEQVVHLNEYPSVVLGSFDPTFLALPQEVLVTVMRHHQKYFSLVDAQHRIRPYFLTVVNTDGDVKGKIRTGHEKVLQARLEDAAFFWEADRKKPLSERVGDLDHVLFQQQLGSYREKTERIRALCRRLTGEPELDTAALLSKVDLTTEMVREFSELQGVMGGLYARAEGQPEEVSRAIYEQYAPASGQDAGAASRLGALLSIADRMDTMVGCFGIGIVPSGSSDPFALRRQAQGLIRLLLDHQLDYRLSQLVAWSQETFRSVPLDLKGGADLLDFLRSRLRAVLQVRGFAYDVLNAVLAVESDHAFGSFQRAEALTEIRLEEDFQALAAAYKRIKNILSGQEIQPDSVIEDLLVETAEATLYGSFCGVRDEVRGHLEAGEYDTVLRRIAGLRNDVDRFFDEVLVMSEETGLRDNRLRLLHDISQLFLEIADISEVVEKTVMA